MKFLLLISTISSNGNFEKYKFYEMLTFKSDDFMKCWLWKEIQDEFVEFEEKYNSSKCWLWKEIICLNDDSE